MLILWCPAFQELALLENIRLGLFEKFVDSSPVDESLAIWKVHGLQDAIPDQVVNGLTAAAKQSGRVPAFV